MVKRCIFMTILAVTSALITQEILWNSWLLSQCTHHDISQLIDVSAPIGGNNIQQHGNYDKKEQFSRLSTKPTNIYALGERNSGTNYLVKSAYSLCNVLSNMHLVHLHFLCIMLLSLKASIHSAKYPRFHENARILLI